MPLRHNPLNTSGVFSLSALIRSGLTASAVDQLGQRQQVGRGERATARGEDHERIYRRDIGPGRRQGEQHAVLVVQVNPVLTPVLAVHDELVLPPEQRVEPMRHAHASVPVVGTGCS